MASTVFPAASAGVTQKVQVFTSTGSFVTPSNTSSAEILIVGGGGAGGGTGTSGGSSASGGGGGGGGVVRQFVSLTPGVTYTVTIGGGGAGVSVSAGTVGTDSTFGSLLTAFGGGGGSGFDNSQNVSTGVGKATSGGHKGDSGDHAGGGGGAAGIPMQSVDAGPLASNSFQKNPNLALAKQGGFGNASGLAVLSHGGIGLHNFGGGGGGAFNGTSTPSVLYVYNKGRHGGGDGASQVGSGATNGSAGTANTGGGGGGGAGKDSGSSTGGAGGSGYCTVTYWS